MGGDILQMMDVFAEFERAMIRERVNAGLARAKAEGKALGRAGRKGLACRGQADHGRRHHGEGPRRQAAHARR